MREMSERLWWVYFAILWWGTNLTKAGVWLSVTVSPVALVIPARTLWQEKGAVFHPLRVLHVICCPGWGRGERWAAHHSLGLSLAFPIRHLMYSVYSWPLQCYRILIDLGFLHVLKIWFYKKHSIAAEFSLPIGAQQEVRIRTEKTKNINTGRWANLL